MTSTSNQYSRFLIGYTRLQVYCVNTQYMMYIQEGDSALMVAVKRGETGIVKELVKGGADLNHQNNVRCYAPWLHCVCPIGGVGGVD